MRRIRILDMETAYATALAEYLSRHLDDCETVVGPAATQDKTIEGSQGVLDPQYDAVVAGEGYFSWKPDDDRIPVLYLFPHPMDAVSLDASDTDNPAKLPRLGDAHGIASTLERYLESSADPVVASTLPGRAPGAVGVISEGCDRVRWTFLARLAEQAQERGGRVVYLPCLPRSRTAFLPLSARGSDTLTQLLLLAGAGDSCDSSIGSSLHPSRTGVLCVRPAENHEHLLECGPDALRTVVSALVRWVGGQPDGSIAIVDLAELPESTAAAALSVCTECHLLIEEGIGARDAPSRFAPLLSRLPPGCRPRRSVLQPPCRRGSPDSGPATPLAK